MEKISKPLYNWSVVLDFYPEKHWYKMDSKFVTSVTAITWVADKSPQLMKWACECFQKALNERIKNGEVVTEKMTEELVFSHKSISKQATDTGTIVHDYCEIISKWWTFDKSALQEQAKSEIEWIAINAQNALNWMNAFDEWVKMNNVKFLYNEMLVYSKKYGYCWKLDTIIEMNWKKYLVDFKTSKGVYLLEYWMQTAWYQFAFEEEHWVQLDWRIIIKLWKDTWDFEVHHLTDYEADFEAFLWAKALLKRKKETDKEQKQKI